MHAYRFHIGILTTNRLINAEASRVLYQQNKFVHLTWDFIYPFPNVDFNWLGVPVVVAHGATEARFFHCVLQIEFKCEQTYHYKSKSPIQACTTLDSVAYFTFGYKAY